MTYEFLQNYWWVLIALLGGLLVALMFVQGANLHLGNRVLSDTQKRMILNSTGRKWELTFTTLVTFGGAFFASFPAVLQHQFRRCLLGVGAAPDYLCVPGRGL